MMISDLPTHEHDKTVLRRKLYNIISQYSIFQCSECADRVQDFLENYGQKYGVREAVRITIATGRSERMYGRIFYGDTLIATNGFHTAIAIDDVIYDNLNPNGIEPTVWQEKFVRIIPPEDWQKYYLDEMPVGIIEGGYETFLIKTTRII